MRFVDRSTVPAPAVLTDPFGPAARERKAVIDFYADPANSGKSFDRYTAYGHPEVREALAVLFDDKCAYCEIDYGGAPWAVEHIRPKGAIEELDLQLFTRVKGAKKLAPGYYWLAADWVNLIPSCTDCNSPRGHRFDGSGKKRTTGKASFFPLEVGSKRSRSHTDSLLVHEKAILLDPCRDEPSDHLRFGDGGTVVSLSERGRVSIGVLGLQRDPLVRRREERRTLLLGKIDLIQQAAAELKKQPDSVFARRVFNDELAAIRAHYLSKGAPFLSMCKQLVRENLKVVNESP